jgi:hypothetical protein
MSKKKNKQTNITKKKRSPLHLAIFTIAILATAGAAWLSNRPAVGADMTVHVMRAPS